jgi:hypothetical protein
MTHGIIMHLLSRALSIAMKDQYSDSHFFPIPMFEPINSDETFFKGDVNGIRAMSLRGCTLFPRG